MPEPIPINVGFPLGGINKATGFNAQPQGTTPSCLNVWPYQWTTGRARGGVRPGLTAAGGGGPAGTPYNWCPASWDGGYGVAVQTFNGVYVGQVTYPSNVRTLSWTPKITTDPGSTFSSCAVYYNKLYSASAAKQNVYTYDFADDSESVLSVENYELGGAKGAVPQYCGLVYADAGRLILAGDANEPHRVYMSRVDNPRDWDWSKTDSGASFATAGSTGKIAKPVIGLLAHGNDCLLVGHIDGISVIIGNMRGGGQIVKTEQEIGPLMQSAWCKTASDHTIMMTREGLYAIPGGCAKSISAQLISDQLPNDLVGIDPGLGDKCSVVYDGRYHGVHIYVNRASVDADDAAYFFDLKNRAFFPMSFAVQPELAISFPAMATATKSGLMVLSNSVAYQFDTESNENITSHCFYGPMAIGSPLTEGVLVRFRATLAESDSDDVDEYGAACRLHFGSSPQEAFNNPTRTITLETFDKKGFNWWQYCRGRGQAAYAEIYGTGQNRWCVEELVGEAYQVATLRGGE